MHQAVEVFEGEVMTVIGNKEEPVSAPGHVARDWSKAGDVDGDVRRLPVGWDVRHFNETVCIELRNYNSNRCLDAMRPRTDAIQISESGDHSNRSMSTHPKVRDAVKKDNSR